MMGRSDVLMRLVLVLASDDVDGCMTGRPSRWSVSLTVDSILLLDRVLFSFAPPWWSLVGDLGQLQCGSENYHSCCTCDDSRKSGKSIYLLIQCPRSDE